MYGKTRVVKALERCKKAHGGLKAYLSTLHIEHVPATKLDTIIESYQLSAENSTTRPSIPRKSSESSKKKLGMSRKSGTPHRSKHWMLTCARRYPSIFSPTQKPELVLIHGVTRANWYPIYDIRVDTETERSLVTLIYKALIKQSTGENWEDVRFTLETARPTFSVGLPTLSPWVLSATPAIPVTARGEWLERERSPTRTVRTAAHHATARAPLPPPLPRVSMGVRSATVSSRGNGWEAFMSMEIFFPNRISLQQHKVDSITKLKRTLGSRRISNQNTKPIQVKLRVVDQIPVSQDEEINVKLISPALPNAPPTIASRKRDKRDGSSGVDTERQVEVSPGVVSQWRDGMDDIPSDDYTTTVGRDGMLSWICDIAPQGKVNLLLQWEVVTPARTLVSGL
ncbi:hypothetical protein AX15_001267 [Amanita polypyramis BW_CC]|nr:hypothetical protein AX15_001267 [Amanita polypyramis BW_CC]